jgi:hypothetical protein
MSEQPKTMKFINGSKREFLDISSEEWREYKTLAGTQRIENPLQLSVSDNGHRVFDAQGVSHYIDTRKGFFLSWKAKDGQPNFII